MIEMQATANRLTPAQIARPLIACNDGGAVYPLYHRGMLRTCAIMRAVCVLALAVLTRPCQGIRYSLRGISTILCGALLMQTRFAVGHQARVVGDGVEVRSGLDDTAAIALLFGLQWARWLWDMGMQYTPFPAGLRRALSAVRLVQATAGASRVFLPVERANILGFTAFATSFVHRIPLCILFFFEEQQTEVLLARTWA